MLKDLKLAMAAAQGTDAAVPMGAAAEALYQSFVNGGDGATDFSGIIAMLDGPPAGLDAHPSISDQVIRPPACENGLTSLQIDGISGERKWNRGRSCLPSAICGWWAMTRRQAS